MAKEAKMVKMENGVRKINTKLVVDMYQQRLYERIINVIVKDKDVAEIKQFKPKQRS